MVHSRTKEQPCPEIPPALLAWLDRKYPNKLPEMPDITIPGTLEKLGVQIVRSIGHQDVLHTLLEAYSNQVKKAKERGS